MIIESLALQHFRSYQKNKFSFSPTTTIIVGSNACGKTNLMEAVSLLATGKSFRAEKDSETVAFDKEVGRVKAKIASRHRGIHDAVIPIKSGTASGQSIDEEKELEIVLTRGEVTGIATPMKRYSINSVPKRMLDFVGTLKVVLFWPQDMELVIGSPGIRRHYLDFVLIQVDREYRRTLISYEKGLRQRNSLLEAIRDGKAHRHQLIFWDQLLIKNGEYITKKREEYIDFVNRSQIDSNAQNSNYQLTYDKSIISRLRLDQYSEEEIAAGVTLVGPHRDDIKFKVKSLKLKVNHEELRDLAHFGSRGEQRLAVLWLKLGELAYIEEKTGEKPVLLLDDILSELDHEHRRIIFDLLDHQQTIMTTTDKHFIEKLGKETNMIELG